MTDSRVTRRGVLAAAGATAVGAMARPTPAEAKETPMAAKPQPLTEHLFAIPGPVWSGVVRDGEKALLIDGGDGRVADRLAGLGVRTIEKLLCTHHHRDQACGADALAAGGAEVVVPAGEREYFANPQAYWADRKSRWHIYCFHPHHLMLAEPVAVDAVVKGGQTLRWGPATIHVLDTPGHTDGSVSYVVEVDGKRVCFCGDAIAAPGQVWNLHALQKGTVTRDYHGFLGARKQLAASLRRIKAAKCDVLVPSHGEIMRDPAAAVDLLLGRLDACYDQYVAISALRWYFPKMFAAYAGRKTHMPFRKGKPVPDCLRHVGTTWTLISRDKAAFVMDCGGAGAVKDLQKRVAAGEIKHVEALWITHYHDDHVDGIPAFRKAFDCPVITDRSVADVVRRPLAWRLPCISPHAITVDRATKDGESWTWREFTMTAYPFPGQTLYHAGLLVEGRGLRMFFCGDSFTPAGIDDYCAQNRNWLGRGVGFDRCLALMQKLRPTHIFNPHVPVAFDFTADELRFMRANLATRQKAFGQLVPWPHANFGTDEPWVRAMPYEQQAKPGEKVALEAVITNHAPAPQAVAARAVLPRIWDHAYASRTKAVRQRPAPTTAWSRANAAAGKECAISLKFPIPANAKKGRYIIPLDIHFADRDLPQFTEAIVVVG